MSAPVVSRRTLLVGGAAAAAALTGACGSDDKKSAGANLDKVRFITTLGTQGRDAYAFVAKEKGFFKEVGIEVDIQPGQAGDYNHQMLKSGQAQFAVVDAAGAVVRYGTGADTSFQVVGAIHQSTLLSIVSLEETGITSAGSLAGRTLATVKGAAPEVLFPAFARLARIDPKGVKWEYGSAPQLNSYLASGRVDGIGILLVGQPGVVAAAKKPVRALPYSDHMRDLFGGVVVTQKETIGKNPDLVRRFTSALLKGLEDSVTNPQDAGKILAKVVPGQNAELAAAELELMRPYVIPANGAPVGVMDESRFALSVGVLQSVGLVPGGANPDLPRQVVNFDLAAKASG